MVPSPSELSLRTATSTLKFAPFAGFSNVQCPLDARLWPSTCGLTRDPSVEKLCVLSAEVSVLKDNDEWDENETADVGGDWGGSGMFVGSTFAPVGLL